MGTSHPLSVGTNNHAVSANSEILGATYIDLAARDADTAFHSSSSNVGKTVKILTGLATYHLLIAITPTWIQSTWPTYQNIAARDADTVFSSVFENVNKQVRVEDADGSGTIGFFILTSVTPTWESLGASLTDSFLELNDTPSSYSGDALKGLRVNSGETDIEFFTSVDTLAGILANGNISGGTNLVISVGDDISLLGGVIDFAEIATPSNPAADTGRLYVEDVTGTTSLFFKDSTGTTTNLILSSGDLTGPNSAADNSIPTYDGTTGKLLQDQSEMFITGGQVGIGTTSPNQKLHVLVSGTSFFTPDDFGVLITRNGFPRIVWEDTSASVNEKSIGMTFGNGRLRVDTFNDAGSLSLLDHILSVHINGNVGIGITTVPTQKFHVRAGSANDLLYAMQIQNDEGTDSGGSAVGVLFSIDTNDTFGKGAIAYERLSSFSRGAFHFLQDTGADTTNPTLANSVMTILNNGRIGMGTVAPAEQLHVLVGGVTTGFTGSPQGLMISRSSAARMIFEETSRGTDLKSFAVENFNLNLNFMALNDDGTIALDNIFVIERTGNIGVNTVSPLEMFHVNAGGTSGFTGSGLQGVLITSNLGPRLVFEDTAEGVGDRVMAIEYNDENLRMFSLNDAGSSITLNDIFVVNRDGRVALNNASPGEMFHVDVSGDSVYSQATEQGLLISRNVNPRLLFEDTSEAVNVKVMIMELVGPTLKILSATDSGTATLNNILTISRTGNIGIGDVPDGTALLKLFNVPRADGDILLQFDTLRAWSFEQAGVSAATQLRLRSQEDNKSFIVTASDNTVVTTVNTDSAVPSNNYFRTDQSWRRTRVTTAVSTNTGAMGQASIYVVTDTTADRTITVSTNDIVGSPGREFIFKDESGTLFANGTEITIDTEGSETIDGVSSITITADFGVISLYSDNSNLFSI